MFLEGHVHSIAYHSISDDCDHCFISGKVMPSLPSRDAVKTPDHLTWVCLSKVSGHVHSAHCSCTAGEGGSCNHVAAVMYATSNMCEKRKNGLTSCTSNTCTWNVPKRSRILSPKKINDRPLRPKKQFPNICIAPVVDFNRLRQKLVEHIPNAGYVLSTAETTESQCATFMLTEPDYNFRDGVDLRNKTCTEAFERYVSSLPNIDVCDIEKKTRGQAKNIVWKNIRQGRLTSCQFGQICHKKESTAADSLLKDIMGYRHVPGVPSVKWGRTYEAAARMMYVKRMQKNHPCIQVTKCGLFVDRIYPFLAASPDGLVTCDHCSSSGLLEVKCPFTHRNSTIIDACQDKSFFCCYVDGSVSLKRTHFYYCQVQGQMAITGRSWVDFVVWTLKDIYIERIQFEVTFWTQMQKKTTSVLFRKRCTRTVLSSCSKRKIIVLKSTIILEVCKQ